MQLPDSAILNNLYVPGFTRPDHAFEKKYIACRSKENRIYTDEEVAQLPDCSPSHPHYQEWLLRKTVLKKLFNYLEQKNRPLSILEIGCGNGWLTHRLTAISRSRVTGIDINFTELQQAARVFNNIHKAKFVYGDIRSGILDDRQFDIILFPASIQYFKSLDGILELCLHHLNPCGEIHIMDTPFYPPKEAEAARKRTENYYRLLGMPEMTDYYFHHSLHELAQFRHSILYDPFSFINRFIPNHTPFHWIRIVKD
jgi:ubiquinone/menaquinone biosynthesis C-methylase UbiE